MTVLLIKLWINYCMYWLETTTKKKIKAHIHKHIYGLVDTHWNGYTFPHPLIKCGKTKEKRAEDQENETMIETGLW